MLVDEIKQQIARAMKSGDVVEVDLEKVGVLSNPVVAEATAAPA